MAALPALAQLADHLLKDAGGLAAFITFHRSDGLSWARLAREIWVATDRQVDATGVTVQTWAERLGIEGNEGAA